MPQTVGTGQQQAGEGTAEAGLSGDNPPGALPLHIWWIAFPKFHC